MEDRIRDLEREVGDLRVANAALAASVEHLGKSVEALTQTVGLLRDTLNKGRGALWLAMLLAGGVGATIATTAKKLFGVAP